MSSSNVKVSNGIYEVAAQKTGSKSIAFKQPHSLTGQKTDVVARAVLEWPFFSFQCLATPSKR